uniref:Uncharacterized protein n=1 Tax=Phlebotomus papatasi TaxID=29031 RepID=A0A1B0DG27_PHLPP
MPHITPQVVAIYCGESKPKDLNGFLNPLVLELQVLLTNGLIINDHKIEIKILSFICDSPARSFVKGVVSYNHTQGCTKCTVTGEYYAEGHHMSYPNIDALRRTDTTFRPRADPEHHKELTPLENLPINMIDQFPIADSLHLLDLGIMRRCLTG